MSRVNESCHIVRAVRWEQQEKVIACGRSTLRMSKGGLHGYPTVIILGKKREGPSLFLPPKLWQSDLPARVRDDVWWVPPAPINHVKYLRAGPPEMPLLYWYNCGTKILKDQGGLFEMRERTRLSNKTSTAWSCPEDQSLENKISRTRF